MNGKKKGNEVKLKTDPDLLEQQREHFNTIAKRYHAARLHPNHQLLKHLIWRHAMKHCGDFKDKPLKVLDAMCGFGEARVFLNEYLSDDLDYNGFDYSDKVVSFIQKEHPAYHYWQADVTTVELKQSSYDVIVLIGGLHHVPDHANRGVKRLASALKPGGIFICFEPTHGNILTRKVREHIYKKNALFDEETERAFAVKTLKDMFEQAGLNNHYIFFPGLLSYVLYYNPDAFPILNKGGRLLVNAAFALDRIFFSTILGQWLSFATFGIWRRPA